MIFRELIAKIECYFGSHDWMYKHIDCRVGVNSFYLNTYTWEKDLIPSWASHNWPRKCTYCDKQEKF